MPRSDRENVKESISEGLWGLWRWVKKKGGIWKGESMGKKIRKCMIKEKEKEKLEGIYKRDVMWMKKVLRK